jgi:uncharacterized protein
VNPVAVVRTAAVVAGVVIVLLGLVWGFQRRLIYLPDTSSAPPAATAFARVQAPEPQDLTLSTDDGLELEAWYVPASDDADRGVTVLAAPGNAGNRESRVPFAEALRDAGFSVLLMDYRGYGGNTGRPSEEGLALDARAALRALHEELDVAPERTLYYGESLGTGVVVELAQAHPPAGLALRSPFPDLAEVGARHYPFLPVRTLLWDRYPTVERIAGIDVPTTVIYGGSDSIIPPELSRSVAGNAAELYEEVEIPGADHNDAALFTGTELLAAIERLADHTSDE